MAPLFVVSMDLLYHVFIFSAIFSHKVSELNNKSSIGRTLSDDINIETDNFDNGVYWITPSTLGNPSGSYGRLVKMDNYKMFASAITTSGIYYTRELWVSIYVNSTWTPFNGFSDDTTISKYQTMDASSDIIQTAENQTSCQTRFYWLNGTSYNGELPADSYKYGSAIVLKRASNSISVAIFSIGKPIYNSYSNGSWSGWRDFTGASV